MGKFDSWWSSIYSDKPKEIHRQCYEEGYEAGFDDAATAAKIFRWFAVALAAIVISVMFSGCQDSFRYPCMDNKNWGKEECQRPACAVTQTCPDQLMKAEELKGEVR